MQFFGKNCGSSRILSGQTIYCGFDHPQYIDREWAEAGFDNKVLYEQLPEYTQWQQTIMTLSSAYAGLDYPRVKASLLARGFTQIAQPQKPVDRCMPGLERICIGYREADCNTPEGSGLQCGFEWESPDKKRLAVIADVRELPNNENEIDVTGVVELNSNQGTDSPTVPQEASTRSLEDWKRAVSGAVRATVETQSHLPAGTVTVGFRVSLDGKISGLRVLGSQVDTTLANAAIRVIQSLDHVPSPPTRQSVWLVQKLTFK